MASPMQTMQRYPAHTPFPEEKRAYDATAEMRTPARRFPRNYSVGEHTSVHADCVSTYSKESLTCCCAAEPLHPTGYERAKMPLRGGERIGFGGRIVVRIVG